MILACLTAAVYLPVMGFGFVAYDDFDYVTSNPHVGSGLSWQNVRWAIQTGHSSNWHPLTWLSLMLDQEVFNGAAGGFHLTNLFFHAANTGLLFLWLCSLTGKRWQSGLAAGLFALHPLHVESVAWIAERKDVLSTFFGLVALLAYGRYAQIRGREAGVRRLKLGIASPAFAFSLVWYAAALASFAFSLMSKPMLVTLPGLLLLLDYWPLRRSAECGAVTADSEKPAPATARRHWPWLVAEKWPFLALSIASSIVTLVCQQLGGAVQSQASFPTAGRMENAVVSCARYLGKAIWPFKLAFFYPHPGHWPAGWVGLAVVLVVGLSMAAIASRRRWPVLFLGWFWYLTTLLPVLGLVQVGLQSMADRYTYVPLIGIFIIVAWTLAETVATWGLPKWVGKCAGFALLWACAVRTADQLEHWRNSETLFRYALSVTQGNYVAHNDLGYYLFNQGRVEEALTHYREALRIKSGYADALNNLGFALAQQGQPAQALESYHAALNANPAHVEARNNLGLALDALGQFDDAAEQYRQVLARCPEQADAHSNLGIVLARQGNLDEAIAHLQAALRYKPNEPRSHNNLANVLVFHSRFEEALAQYRQALQLNPQYAEAHNNLGGLLARLGRREEAIAHLREALRLKPDYPEASKQLRDLGVPGPD